MRRAEAPEVIDKNINVAPDAAEPKRNWLAFWFLLPASVILVAVLGYPIVKMVVLSLQEAKLRNITLGTESWNNFENYTK
ncbi:MAG: hypothetical protein OEV20_00755, partial [Actinomycetota bacterium]|nr:hypothetical protein [Actinomycetota bacterium]